ncbi:MAG: NAD(+)/NADH kinase [Burkholderiales bacterium]|nr:NAD(+)/NADH kinase [Opitutaceae bacterium]
MTPIRRLAFVVNEQKPGARDLAEDLVALAASLGVETRVTHAFPLPTALLRDMDACCVIGGDGTLLGAAPAAAETGVPLIGVNRGSLGFLTTFTADEARDCLPTLLSGDFVTAERALLSCHAGSAAPVLALNDILIKDASNSRLVRLEVHADGELVTDYLCDGLIFSTPTGSTAYNLSAGGPLIHPSAEVLAMTPICPHTLTNRAIIFRAGVRLRVINHSDAASGLIVVADGRVLPAQPNAAPIDISLAPHRLRLIQRRDHSHFAVVRAKLKWSGGASDEKR